MLQLSCLAGLGCTTLILCSVRCWGTMMSIGDRHESIAVSWLYDRTSGGGRGKSNATILTSFSSMGLCWVFCLRSVIPFIVSSHVMAPFTRPVQCHGSKSPQSPQPPRLSCWRNPEMAQREPSGWERGKRRTQRDRAGISFDGTGASICLGERGSLGCECKADRFTLFKKL